MQHAQSKVKPAVNDARVDEDALRVHLYRLIAHYLSAPPTQADLELAAGLSASSETLLGERIGALAAAARSTLLNRKPMPTRHCLSGWDVACSSRLAPII